MKLPQLIKTMNHTDQLSGRVTVLEHGQMVKERLLDLIRILKGEAPLLEWIIPPWLKENERYLQETLPSFKTIYLYSVMHDCGKPFCREKDDKG